MMSGCMAGPKYELTDPPRLAKRMTAPLDMPAPPADPGTLGPDDKIAIVVAREPDLSAASVMIDANGTFSMPGVGRIKATGHTPDELARQIAASLSANYINQPQVSINIVERASRRVTVEGAVTNPGIYQYPVGATLVDAIALAHGPQRVAKLDRVAIFRTEGDVRSVAVFDFKLVRAGRMSNPRLMPGDRIQVGFSGLTQVWQDFLQSAPVFNVFTRF
ncbi:MAG: hypothetical protein ABT10_08120 [Novosphingobium sp. SCN 63-17]|nr:polysaccharide export protein [Novosphingobium sp.]ODU83144.1 MAG: hypothetical protein ABT10_08120 [Novosphingobium sp. SCN 63-17]OJX88114.1 MAG: hypothetical protein BGP00_02020 [Novosphingobium sp. 63-713]